MPVSKESRIGFRGVSLGGILLLALAVAGCAIPNKMPTLGGENVTPVKDATLVFGRISVIGPNGPMIWKGWTCHRRIAFDCPKVFRVYVSSASGTAPLNDMLSGDGSFYWLLQPGDYVIAGFMLADWQGPRLARTFAGRIAAKFTVPPGKSAVYVGTTEMPLGGRSGVRIKDEFEAAKSALAERGDAPAGEPYKSLAVVERLPDESRATDVCSSVWSLECTDEFKGLRPVSPKVYRDEFAVASSLAPTLEWKPSGDPNATYDLAVYEAVRLDRLGLKPPYIRGPVVEYASDIESTRYKLKNPLKPDTKYFWSVRARKNGRVSSWSTISYKYFTFLIFGFVSGSGSGVHFNFTTP